MAEVIHIQPEQIKSATRQIQESLNEVLQQAESTSNLLEEHSGAYGEGDADREQIQRSFDDIASILKDNAEKINTNVEKLNEFADKMEAARLQG